ncbi:MAG: TIGR03936 family radical SAM-associated protein, partial [Defluviitaleaceae bacterium]|nr:TIGR03936 family radical SAM-associated protein [Defluviitaleaceae bacterium]
MAEVNKADTISKYCLVFSKRGALKFLGHLDFMRAVQKTVRRSMLPVSYSRGYNPHMLLSFALPLPLGMEASADYAELVLEGPAEGALLAESLNACAPEGLIFFGAGKMAEGSPSLAAEVSSAGYVFNAGEPALNKEIEEAVGWMMGEQSIIVNKKTKRGEAAADVRRDVISAESRGDGIVFMRLSAGGRAHLNPELVADLIKNRSGATRARSAVMTRTGLY